MFDVRWTAVLGLSLLGLSLSAGSASAFLAYVSNEKGNSISVIDTDKMETVATIKTGQRPRGIEVSRDGKLVYVALGDDDMIQVFDAKTFNERRRSAVGSGSRTIHHRSGGQDSLRRQRERRDGDRARPREARLHRRGLGRHRARGHDGQPGFQDADMHVGNDQHGSFHRHRQAARSSAICWSALVRAFRHTRPTDRSYGSLRRSAATSPSSIRRHGNSSRP